MNTIRRGLEKAAAQFALCGQHDVARRLTVLAQIKDGRELMVALESEYLRIDSESRHTRHAQPHPRRL